MTEFGLNYYTFHKCYYTRQVSHTTLWHISRFCRPLWTPQSCSVTKCFEWLPHTTLQTFPNFVDGPIGVHSLVNITSSKSLITYQDDQKVLLNKRINIKAYRMRLIHWLGQIYMSSSEPHLLRHGIIKGYKTGL